MPYLPGLSKERRDASIIPLAKSEKQTSNGTEKQLTDCEKGEGSRNGV